MDEVGMDQVDKDNEWEKTTKSGKIFAKLQAIGRREGKIVAVVNKDGMMETFKFGDQEAYLLKRLEGGTVGGQDGVLITYAEGYHYKRFPWWKEAVDASSVQLELLDTPVLWVAKDAEVEGYEDLFSPKKIVSRLQLPNGSQSEAKVKQLLSAQIAPHVSPDYRVDDFMGGLRLAAVSDEAIKSRTQDNEVYNNAVGKIKEVASQLPNVFQSLMAAA